MQKVTSRWPHQDSIKVEWNLTKRCNYDCSYCPDIIHDNVSKPTDIEILKSTIDKLVTIGKPIRISFTGGEPTVHNKFEELVNYAKHVGVKWVSVTTNGTRQAEWYIRQNVNQYVFSLHFEYDWKRVINTVLEVHSKSAISKLVHVMAHHDYMTDVMIATEMLAYHKVPYSVRRIRWTDGDHYLFDDMRYHPDDLKWIKATETTTTGNVVIDDKKIMHANDVIKLHMNQYKDWTCNAGLESLMINWDGEVHRATCRVGGSLGNIYQGTVSLPTEPIICDRNFCTCASDIPLTKIAPTK